MGLFGIGNTNRILVDVPVRYAPILGLPYDPDDESVFEQSGKKINIKVPLKDDKGLPATPAVIERHAYKELMKYGIPAQEAKSLVGKKYELLEDSSDPRYEEWQLEASSPEDVAAGRGRLRMPTGIDVATGAEYGDVAPVPRRLRRGTYDAPFTPFEEQTVTGERVAETPGDPFGVNVREGESKSVADAIAAMEKEQKRQASKEAQERAERKAWELRMEQEREAAAKAEREARTRAQIEADQAAAREAEEAEAREAKAEADRLAREAEQNALTNLDAGGVDDGTVEDIVRNLSGGADDGTGGFEWDQQFQQINPEINPEINPQVDMGPWTPFEDSTGIRDMLNIFNQDPERYYTTETVIGPDGQAITQQVLSPVAQAALQAFSTQRGAEAMETGARFGAGSPFGVIAGMGGETSAADAINLAEQQAYSGITSPFAALQTGGGINDISQILRGGLSTQQQSDLAGLQARGGLGVEDQFALAGMQARGGLSPEQMRGLAGLQARGGLTPQQRYAEQRLAMMPSLLQMSPQSLGGFSEVFGGPEALQEYLSPFFTQPDFSAQGAAPAVNWGAQQALPQSMAPATGTPMEPYVDPNEWGVEPWTSSRGTGGVPVSAGRGGGVPISAGGGVPISATAGRNVPIAAGGMQTNENIARGPTAIPTRQTLGGFQKATPFARGGTQAKAAIAGQDLEDYLGEVTPFGGATRRGGFGSRVSDRFTY